MKLIFVYTLKCNAECQICCFNCGPDKNEKMDYEMVSDCIKQAAKTKAFEEISFTGGEALLYKDEVEDLIELSSRYHFKTLLTTNAFWAESIDSAYEMLYELKKKGLSILSVSADEFHQSFIPNKYIENLIKANDKIKIPIFFQSLITKKTAQEHPLAIKYPQYTWRKGLCQPVGRAAETMPWDDYIYDDYDGKCIYANTITIMPDGACYPCCSQGLRMDNLKIGSVCKQTLEEIIKEKEQHKFTKVMVYRGPEWLKKMGESQGYKLSDPKSSYVSLCHLCHEISKDQVYLEKMKDIISETAYQISYSQLLKIKEGQ
ncbi:radical SAM/SPASM domain-containing protein [Anaerovorax odorimutans]|uniref:radical SAM/SPASM domain-containing protein n=1 Tax=Anaerovorax odorimutans TaxID=109327 RepID=UPI000424568E|nr:radical SAM/SPASM domain-containing protein [Anaerovorax odorimutans]